MMQADRADQMGAVASSLCAIHCAVGALLPAAFGAFGVGFLLGDRAEWAFTLVAVGFAGAALTLGWRRHRDRTVLVLLVVGVVGVLASRAVESMHDGHDDCDGHAQAAALEARGAHGGVGSEGAGLERWWHGLGTMVGVLAGTTLVGGHLVNLRASRRCTTDACH